MKRVLSLFLALTLVLGLTAPVLAAETKTFTDVSADADYAQAVAWCVENGLMNGVNDGATFDPDGSMTRAMLATVLYRQAGSPAVTGAPGFTDTQPNVWYSNAIVWANQKNLLRGYGNGIFGVNDPVSREMLTVVMARQKGEDPAWTGNAALAVPAKRSEAAVALMDTFAPETPAPLPSPSTRPSGGGSSRPSSGGSRPSGGGSSGGSSTPTPTPTPTPAPTPTPTPNPTPEPAKAKMLVAYFSATGSTERVAGYIAQATGADLFEMEPVEPYTSADLNYGNSSSRVSREHNDPSLQNIALVKTTPDNWDDYDVIFIGYPIWWHAAAWPVNHFVTDNDFTGKIVIPFCTSASSPLEGSDEKLAAMTETGDWKSGQRFQSSASQSAVESWVDGLDLSKPAPSPAPEEPEGRTLVVYFSMPDNVDDSTVTINGEVLGNNQYMAQVIQEATNADIFRIEAATPYPTDHQTLVNQASQEKADNARPAIKEAIENFEQYDTVFVGYPIWWSDMPMILYTFFDSYDLSGKTLIPFGTHGGSGWAGTPAKIAQLEPDANMLDGLSISRNVIEDAHDQIVEWVQGLDV